MKRGLTITAEYAREQVRLLTLRLNTAIQNKDPKVNRIHRSLDRWRLRLKAREMKK